MIAKHEKKKKKSNKQTNKQTKQNKENSTHLFSSSKNVGKDQRNITILQANWIQILEKKNKKTKICKIIIQKKKKKRHEQQ